MSQTDLTGRVIGCCFTVYNELGFGFSEGVYSRALEILFRERGIRASREHSFDIMFRGCKVGTVRVDYFVEDTLVLELKAAHRLPEGSMAQLLSNVRTSKKHLGLLFFFGPTPEVQRITL
jgi:GxxExxY protein